MLDILLYGLYTDSIFLNRKLIFMSDSKFKLIIWDFDGVIADTEKLWLIDRQKLLNERFNLNWDFNTTNHYLGGMSDLTKRSVLDSLGIKTNDQFWADALALDYQAMKKGFSLTPGIEDIFKLKQIKQCIATGGIRSKTEEKIKTVHIESYFAPEKIFTADMVKYGKPEPDLFLLAAKKMNTLPKDCLVVEDSLAGMKAGLKAGMTTVAFAGFDMNNTPENIQKIKEIGVTNIFFSMADLKDFILTHA